MEKESDRLYQEVSKVCDKWLLCNKDPKVCFDVLMAHAISTAFAYFEDPSKGIIQLVDECVKAAESHKEYLIKQGIL